MKDWKSIRIKFQTPAVLPAPYSYFYTLDVTSEEAGLGVSLALQYLDRDELDEEMILEEGFSLDDDFGWEGILPSIWRTELIRMLEKLDPDQTDQIGEQDNYLVIEINDSNGTVDNFIPNDRQEWDYFQQELIQAIYEAAGKERSFDMEYWEIEGKNQLKIHIIASFAHREFSISINGKEPVSLNWRWTKKVMETVFKADFLPSQTPEEIPRFSGKYLTVGDGVWYEFDESIVEPSPKSKVLPQIIKLMDQLREEAIR